jgi:hypothetical protein
MTVPCFLEYVCMKLLGQPTHTEGGCPCWPCPRCEHRGWHVRPPSDTYKDRCSCWSCGWWGDAYDLLRQLCPQEKYPQRKVRLGQLRAEYDREGAAAAGAGAAAGAAGAGPRPGAAGPAATRFSSRGRGGVAHGNAYGRSPQEDEFCPAANEAIAELREALAHLSPEARRDTLEHCQKALALCARYGLHPDGLAGRCGFQAWSGYIEDEHKAQCQDPQCDWGSASGPGAGPTRISGAGVSGTRPSCGRGGSRSGSWRRAGMVSAWG